MIDAPTRTQFKLIAELAGLLANAHIRFWLRGGWALDFRIGEITRSHADIDVVTWSRHRTRLRHLLEGRGYHVDRVVESAAIHFAKRGQDIGAAFIVKDPTGQIVTPDREFWPWPPDAFPTQPTRLRNVTCRAMSLEALLEEKENYQRYARRALRSKDRESIRVLRSLLPSGR